MNAKPSCWCCSSSVGLISELLNLRSWKRKNELDTKQFWRFSLKVRNLSTSLVRWCGAHGSNLISFGCILRYFSPNLIFLIKTWSRGLAATLWFRGTTQTERREVQDSGSGCCCRCRLVKSSKANSTPPTWLHFPLPSKPSPAGHVHVARSTSHWGVNSITTRYGVFFIDGNTLALT